MYSSIMVLFYEKPDTIYVMSISFSMVHRCFQMYIFNKSFIYNSIKTYKIG